ncbi:hypothetical protein D9M68_666190 [compost metagenome]
MPWPPETSPWPRPRIIRRITRQKIPRMRAVVPNLEHHGTVLKSFVSRIRQLVSRTMRSMAAGPGKASPQHREGRRLALLRQPTSTRPQRTTAHAGTARPLKHGPPPHLLLARLLRHYPAVGRYPKGGKSGLNGSGPTGLRKRLTQWPPHSVPTCVPDRAKTASPRIGSSRGGCGSSERGKARTPRNWPSRGTALGVAL